MNIYLITFDFTNEYGIAHCVVAAHDEQEAKTVAKNVSWAKWYAIDHVELLDPAQYTEAGLIRDIIYIQ